jgi:hypothetical protein
MLNELVGGQFLKILKEMVSVKTVAFLLKKGGRAEEWRKDLGSS